MPISQKSPTAEPADPNQPTWPTRPTQPTQPTHSTRNTDHLVPHANRLLATAARAAWHATKLLASIAIRIPGWFVRINKR